MSYYRIHIEKDNDEKGDFDFTTAEFQIAQATFQACAAKDEVTEALLILEGGGKCRVVLADKAGFLRFAEMQQQEFARQQREAMESMPFGAAGKRIIRPT